MVLIWRIKSALILSLLFYLIDYLNVIFPFSLCLIVKYIVVCFFLSLIMNFFCPPRLALATCEPGEYRHSSSENLQMLIQVFIPEELSSFSVFSVFDSISSRFSLLYSAREEEILDCGSSSSLLARELKEHKKYSYCFVFVPALEHKTRFALASCTQKKKTCDAS